MTTSDILILGASLGLLAIGIGLWLWERKNPNLLERAWVYSFRQWGGAGLIAGALGLGAIAYALLGDWPLAIFIAGAGVLTAIAWFKVVKAQSGPLY